MFQTDRLIIREISESDIEEVRLLHNDISTLKWLTDISVVSESQQIKWFLNLKNSTKNKRYVARDITDSTIVGVFRLDDVDFQNKSAQVGLDIASNFRQKGYATEIYNRMLAYIFTDLGMNRVGLVTLSNNIAARALYSKLSFKKEGILREAIFRNGTFVDLFQYGLLCEEWKLLKVNDA